MNRLVLLFSTAACLTSASTVGFLDNAGTFTEINDPLSTGTILTGVDNAGDIVGWSGVRGFLKSGANFSTIADPAASCLGRCVPVWEPVTYPLAISDSGHVVGRYGYGGGSYRFLTWEGFSLTSFTLWRRINRRLPG